VLWTSQVSCFGEAFGGHRTEHGAGNKFKVAKKVTEDIATTKDEVNEHSDKAASVKRSIKELKFQLEEARDRVSRAQDELDQQLRIPVPRESSHYEDLQMAQSLAPSTRVQKKGKHKRSKNLRPTLITDRGRGLAERGWVSDTARQWIGWNADKHHREDLAHEEKYRARDEQRQQEIIAEARARRDAERQRAEASLQQARDREQSIADEISQARRDLRKNEDSLADAKAQLSRANTDLKRLGQDKMEVVSSSRPYAKPGAGTTDPIFNTTGRDSQDSQRVYEPARQAEETDRATHLVLLGPGDKCLDESHGQGGLVPQNHLKQHQGGREWHQFHQPSRRQQESQ
jgi:archaellum component FlaC